MKELRILSPTGILGYGFPPESLAEGMSRSPHAIGVDAGSTDPGPYYLGMQAKPEQGDFGELGQLTMAMEADLVRLIKAARKAGIPLLIGSAGWAGGDMHLKAVETIIRGIARKESLKFRMALIHAEMDKKLVTDKLASGKISPLGPVPELTQDDIDRSIRIVAQMGVEPFVRALDMGAEVVLAGRSSDPNMFAALPIQKGYDKGLALHMGKILECGAIAADPGSGGDVIMGTIREDHFLVEPMNPIRRCTVQSAAAHSLYETSDPWHLKEPGGMLDLEQVVFKPETDRCVRIKGTRFVEDEVCRVKIEGAALEGYRTICVAGVRDPSAVAHIEEMLDATREKTQDQFSRLDPKTWSLYFRVYGRDGVMGPLEKEKSMSRELGLIIEAIAATQDEATSICMFVHASLLHYGFEGRTSTAGNLAFPFSPQDMPVGPVYRFNVYHLMEVDDPLAHFPIEMIEVGNE